MSHHTLKYLTNLGHPPSPAKLASQGAPGTLPGRPLVARAGRERDAVKNWRKPLDMEQYKSPRGRLHLIPDRCKGCGFCVEFCPKQVLEVSDDFNAKGYHIPKVVEGGVCVACGMCERICPDFAIFVERYEVEGKPSRPRAPPKEEASA